MFSGYGKGGLFIQNRYDLAVVGGGAAGLTAAVAAAEEYIKRHKHARIVVLEANSRVGKKILATGNGRCNLTNSGIDPIHYHGDTSFLPDFLSHYPPEKIISFFQSIGLVCREQDEGRVYPYNLQASAVLDVLRRQLEHFQVETICDFPVTRLKKTAQGFELFRETESVTAAKVIVATGGMAYPQLGANGSGYQILKELGHNCTKLIPSLVQVTTEPRRAKPLKGARSPARASLYADGKLIAESSGEVQFTERGLSGICIFELSRMVGERYGRQKLELSLDLMPEYPLERIVEFLKQQSEIEELPALELCSGFLNKLVAPEVVKAALPHVPKTVGELDEHQLEEVARTVKRFRFPVTGTLDWKDAQVTAGGIPLDEVDSNLQSRCCPGLYLAGEILNIDGDCGGFNLHWAWSTGLAAGRSAAKAESEGEKGLGKPKKSSPRRETGNQKRRK